MKKAVVIGTFPTDKTTEKMLLSCIESVKAFEWDVILVSHKPLSPDIISMVDYYIYDKKNILEPHHLTPVYWYSCDLFYLSLNGNGHIVPVCRNMINGIGLADLLGYKFCFYMESDNILTESDVNNLVFLQKDMILYEKEMIFFKLDGERFESLIFGTNPHYFMSNHKLPMQASDIEKWKYPLTLEQIFYHNFHDLKEDCILIDKPSHEFLKTSDINILGNYFKVLIVKVKNSDNYILWVSNYSGNPDNIHVNINDEHIYTIVPNGYIYIQVTPNSVYDVKISEADRVYRKKFFTSEKDLKEYDNNGYIRFT